MSRRIGFAWILFGLFVSGWAQAPPEPPAPPSAVTNRTARTKLPRVAILEFKASPGCWQGWRQGGWGPRMTTIS
ncbi:MAG TPA: hypothetical protein VF768_03335, partial [Holophagaceae bacterium]